MGQESGGRSGGNLLLPTLFGHDKSGSVSSDMAAPAASNHKKAAPPKLGDAFGSRWGDSSLSWHTLPGGGVVQFNLDKLTLADYRMMRDHYQVNASLSVLTFMMHQLDWRIECDNAKIKKHIQENMEQIWTRLVRAMSVSFWAGFSPNILQWENDIDGRTVQLTKVKDLVPEESFINWKLVEGWAPPNYSKPKIRVYDGIKQHGGAWPIPVDNTFWYPLLMENGSHYGKKLLRPAFTSWFFSIIMHLFSNRYFERFGEPVPIGRAPYEEELDIDGEKVNGRDVMMGVLRQLRNRSAVVLPDQRSGEGTNMTYDYNIEYLESQMRGADFERYLMRLDEEISLGLFTPLLMLRTADVGSYNLGTTHAQVYMQMLNALAGDWKEYIDQYIIKKMVAFNFGTKAAPARIKFRKLGDDKIDLVKLMLQQMLATNTVKPDLTQLGELAGLSLTEVEVVTAPQPEPAVDPNADPAGGNPDSQNARQLAGEMFTRVEAQLRKGPKVNLGYQRKFEEALVLAGRDSVSARADYSALVAFVGETIDMREPGEEIIGKIRKGIDASLGVE